MNLERVVERCDWFGTVGGLINKSWKQVGYYLKRIRLLLAALFLCESFMDQVCISVNVWITDFVLA